MSTRPLRVVCLLGIVAVPACGRGPRPDAVSPAEIPALEARVRGDPRDATLRFRLAGAYLAAERCDEAVRVAQEGLQRDPDNVSAPLLVGACQERAGRYDLAVATYGDFAAHHPGARGVAALHARKQTALRRGAEVAARTALAREEELTALAPEPATVAVLPLTVSGDTAYRALSRGLAELIITDLATIRSLRLLERLHVGALLDELRLTAAGRVDTVTAARVGHLLRAERMIQGVADIPSERATVRLQASVVGVDGTVHPGAAVAGRFPELLHLEKRLVLGLAAHLGIALTMAERQRILQQGPQSLAAFLAYSKGLDAMDRGDYGTAAAHFQAALRSEPGFAAAEQFRQAAEAAPLVEHVSADGLITVPDAVVGVARSTASPTERAARDVVSDVAPSLGDAVRETTTDGSDATERDPTLESSGITNLQGASGIIRIIFRRP